MRAIRPIAQAAQPRLAHRAALLRELQAHPRLSRAALARATGLHKATISNLVQELIDEGFLVEVDRAQGRTGRPSVMLEFARAGKLIDLGSVLDATAMKSQYSDSWLQLGQVDGVHDLLLLLGEQCCAAMI